MMNRRDAVARLLKSRSDLIVVSGLGSPTYDVAAAGDHPRNVYLWGAMGGAAMVGLGIAVAQPTVPVLVVTGDGEMLMGIGSLGTIAMQQPRNLTICVLDNEMYGETGGQQTHTARHASLMRLARGFGIEIAHECLSSQELDEVASSVHDPNKGLSFVNVRIDVGLVPRVMTSRSGVTLVDRTRRSLGLEQS